MSCLESVTNNLNQNDYGFKIQFDPNVRNRFSKEINLLFFCKIINDYIEFSTVNYMFCFSKRSKTLETFILIKNTSLAMPHHGELYVQFCMKNL